MGRARRRERLAQQAARSRPSPVPAPQPGGTQVGASGERRLHDPEWRRAERRRIARLNRLPDPFRTWGDRSRAHALAVALLQGVIVTVVGLLLLRAATGQWLPPYAAVVVLALAVLSQALCRAVNRRADARAARP